MSLRSVLQPWHEVLSSVDVNCDSNVLWLHVHNSKTGHTIIEGLELLARLAMFSANEFYAAVGEIWNEGVLADYKRSCSQPRVGIHIHAEHYALKGMDEFLAQVFNGKTRVSHACKKARHTFKQARGDDNERSDIPTHVHVGGADRRFRKILKLVTTLAKRCRSEAPQFSLQITKVELHVAQSPPLDNRILAQVVELLEHGVEIVGCYQPQLDLTVKAAASKAFHNIQRLFLTHDSLEGAGIEDISLSLNEIPLSMGPSLFSAFAASRSPRKLNVDGMYVRNELVISCLAGFSRLANHAIEHVRLDISTTHDLEMLREVADADDPLPLIYRERAQEIHRYQLERATASRFALYDPVTTADDDNFVVDTFEHTKLRVIGRWNDWWNVLLPAWGPAWVQDADIVLSAEVEVPTSGCASIRRLEITSINDSLYYVATLLTPSATTSPFVSLFPNLQTLPSTSSTP